MSTVTYHHYKFPAKACQIKPDERSGGQEKHMEKADGERIAAIPQVDGVEEYDGPAGGWGALSAVAAAVREQMGVSTKTRALLQLNQPTGFDCPGCAWPDGRRAAR